MLRLPLIAASVLAFGLPADSEAASIFAFDRESALPHERVTVRSASSKPARLYLVRQELAAAVSSRTDRRLSFIGSIGAGRSLTFSMPPLDGGTYVLAVWCGGCDGARFRKRVARLRLQPAPSCPVTLPNRSRPPGQPRHVSWYGNGLLWAGVERDGTYTVPPDQVGADGTIGNKLLWVTTPPWEKPAISGERIDAAAPPLQALGVNTGSFAGAANPSHMSPVGFPSAGCWRLTARLRDLSLVYVVQVVVASG